MNFTLHVIEVPKVESYTSYEITAEEVLMELSNTQNDILELKEKKLSKKPV